MSKKIVKVMVFYNDGTFDDCIAGAMVQQPSLTYPPGVRTPDYSSPYAPAPLTNPVDYKSCSKCGIKLDGVMGYVCTTPQCPTGLGGAWCSDNV